MKKLVIAVIAVALVCGLVAFVPRAVATADETAGTKNATETVKVVLQDVGETEVSTQVLLREDSTLESIVKEAISERLKKNVKVSDSQDGRRVVTKVAGLKNGKSGSGNYWVALVNGLPVEDLSKYSCKLGNIKNGMVVTLKYTKEFGNDLGVDTMSSATTVIAKDDEFVVVFTLEDSRGSHELDGRAYPFRVSGDRNHPGYPVDQIKEVLASADEKEVLTHWTPNVDVWNSDHSGRIFKAGERITEYKLRRALPRITQESFTEDELIFTAHVATNPVRLRYHYNNVMVAGMAPVIIDIYESGDTTSNVSMYPGAQITGIDGRTYRFEGWYEDEDTLKVGYGFGSHLTRDKDIYAKWKDITPLNKKLPNPDDYAYSKHSHDVNYTD